MPDRACGGLRSRGEIGFEDSVNVAEETHAGAGHLPAHAVEHEHFEAWTGFPVLCAPSCVALIVQKLFEDAIVFAYAGELLALGVVLWLISSPASRRP